MRLLVEVIMRCEYVVATLLMFLCLSTSKTTLLLMTADRRDIRQLHSAPVHLDEIHVLFVQDEGCGFFGKMCQIHLFVVLPRSQKFVHCGQQGPGFDFRHD